MTDQSGPGQPLDPRWPNFGSQWKDSADQSASAPPAEQGLAGPDALRITKVCPACAEAVLDAARICRYCGHAFDPVFAKANPRFVRLDGPLPSRRVFTPQWLIVRVLLPLLIIGGIFLFILLRISSALQPHPLGGFESQAQSAIVMVMTGPPGA